ncbi:hypothetical protein L2E82_06622 [Cichorium intybus]|uniref:Uncharacterized protein n=1 Tax=Cichorium intybus TaxID=13427 RepID=A0ACB9HAD1_CICIN|nr:hypothetical protein L2E82_06622 [Cichorium intybus]
MTSVSPLAWKPLHVLFSFLLITAVEFLGASSQQFLTSERTTLLNLKQRWGNPSSLRNWDASSSPCNWTEVLCNPNGSVIVLTLMSKGLTGPIPPFICEIRNLENLFLSDNFLIGEFPRVFYNCSKLIEIDIAQNGFAGRLPDDIDRLSGLKSLDLGGEIPRSLQRCHSLHTIQLNDNSFTGEFPPGIWTLFNLSSLRLAGNFLSGELPSRVARNLSRVEISDNKFSGKIPDGILSWTKLNVLKASNNLLSGEIPTAITNLSQLSVLLLDGNTLSGQLPAEIKSWNSLTTLHLARNKLFGPIPLAISYLQGLLDLDLSENQLSGEIPQQMSRLRLTALNLSSNKLTGRIPFAFDNLAFEHTVIILVAILCTLFVVRRYLKKKQIRDLTAWKLVEN